MPRSTELWCGQTPDTPPPPRVRIRVFDAHGGRCHCCGRKILAGEKWQIDHVVALINGGANNEGNLAPILTVHHIIKTCADVLDKAEVAAKRAKHLGVRNASYRPLPFGRNDPRKKTLSGAVVDRATGMPWRRGTRQT